MRGEGEGDEPQAQERDGAVRAAVPLLPLVQGHLGGEHAKHDQDEGVERLLLLVGGHFVHTVQVVAVADKDHLLLVHNDALAVVGRCSGARPGHIGSRL